MSRPAQIVNTPREHVALVSRKVDVAMVRRHASVDGPSDADGMRAFRPWVPLADETAAERALALCRRNRYRTLNWMNSKR